MDLFERGLANYVDFDYGKAVAGWANVVNAIDCIKRSDHWRVKLRGRVDPRSAMPGKVVVAQVYAKFCDTPEKAIQWALAKHGPALETYFRGTRLVHDIRSMDLDKASVTIYQLGMVQTYGTDWVYTNREAQDEAARHFGVTI